MDTKACFKCGEEKPLTEFYRHAKMADGRLNKCVECCKAYASERSKLPHVREYDRKRAKLPDAVARRKAYEKTERGKAARRKAQKKYLSQSPYKRLAHNMLNAAVRDGKVRKQPCEVCGAEKTHAHHDDYAKPLDVRWLCPEHHKLWHRENGPGLNAEEL